MNEKLNNKVWKHDFFTVWAGQGISIFTSAVLQMAMVWYLTERTKSALVLTMATLIGYLPQVVLGPFVGVLIDKYNRKYVMIISDICIMLVSLLLVVFGQDGNVPIWVILFIMFARSVGASFHNPSLQAITPMLVPREGLTRYAGVSQGIESISMLLSPGVAALLFSFMNLNQLVLADVAGVVIAVFTLCQVSIPRLQKDKKSEYQNLIKEAGEGIQVIKQVPGLASLIFVSALYAIIYFPIGTLFPLISMDYFNGSFQISGIVETMFSAGMLFGSVALGILSDRISKPKAIIFAIGLYGAGLLVTGLLPPAGISIFIILSFVMGVSIPFYRGVKLAIIQSKVDKQYLGRVLSLTTSLQSMAMPVGLILAGSFVEVIGVNRWFLLSGVLSLLLAGVSYMLPSFRACGD